MIQSLDVRRLKDFEQRLPKDSALRELLLTERDDFLSKTSVWLTNTTTYPHDIKLCLRIFHQYVKEAVHLCHRRLQSRFRDPRSNKPCFSPHRNSHGRLSGC